MASIDRCKLVEDINTAIKKYHDKSLLNHHSVCHLYSDGEVTLQKGGDLYGRRTEHVAEYGASFPPIQGIEFPDKVISGHGQATLPYDEAIKIRRMMMSYWK